MSSSPSISVDQNANDVKAAVKEADAEQARGVLEAEQAKPEADQRKTVLEAAQARLDELAPVVETEGEVLEDGIPDGAWAQLLDADGEPLLVDGNPVDAGIVP